MGPLELHEGESSLLSRFGEGTWDCSLGAAETKGSCHVDGGISWFSQVAAGGLGFLRYGGELREPLLLPQRVRLHLISEEERKIALEP